jgi:hypothetical protein
MVLPMGCAYGNLKMNIIYSKTARVYYYNRFQEDLICENSTN